jgi:mannose-1-phosphate guanylyltransferase
MDPTADVCALVLAGGDGTRLQDLTRLISGAPIPKQYCPILDSRSLLELTLDRVRPLVPPERTFVIINHDHLALALPQLTALPEQNAIVQPRNLDTGPGLILSLSYIARRHPRARIALFPSDHYVGDEESFRVHVERVLRLVAALPTAVALLGIRPDDPEPGYGYIEPGARVAVTGTTPSYRVAAFHEKPSPPEAMRLIRRGGLWNSFVMAFHLPYMMVLLAAHRPADVARIGRQVGEPAAIDDLYGTLTPWNLSRDLLTRIPEQLAVVPAEHLAWSDWGTRQAIERTLARLNQPPPWWQTAGAASL